MVITQMTMDDIEKYRNMNTGMSDDYVKDAIEYLIENNYMFKAEDDDGTLLSICKLEDLKDGFGFLGSARTSIYHRSMGISTKLTFYVMNEARGRGYRWVGLTTDETNIPVHHMMDKLGLKLIGKSVACTLKENLDIKCNIINDRQEIFDLEEKRGILEHNLLANHRKFFYYTPYYALPYWENAISDEYIRNLKVIRTKNEYYFIKDMDWGGGFTVRQMHFYGGCSIHFQEVVEDFLMNYYDRSFSEIWIEALDINENEVSNDIFKEVRGWRLYGIEL